jgi:hypothetical protein
MIESIYDKQQASKTKQKQKGKQKVEVASRGSKDFSMD